MRHSRYFTAFLRQFKTIKVMLNERFYLDEYGSWKLDQDTRTKVNGFRAVITQFPAIHSKYDHGDEVIVCTETTQNITTETRQ